MRLIVRKIVFFFYHQILTHDRLKKIDNKAHFKAHIIRVYTTDVVTTDICELTRQAGIRLVNQPRVARNFDTILLNRPNEHHGTITHKTENSSTFSSIIARASN